MNILGSYYSLWNNETISKISKEIPVVSSYPALVGSPEEYNNITTTIIFFEFLFRPYKPKMLDKELWHRWIASAKSTMSTIINYTIASPIINFFRHSCNMALRK